MRHAGVPRYVSRILDRCNVAQGQIFLGDRLVPAVKEDERWLS
jgi:hypothetical protein